MGKRDEAVQMLTHYFKLAAEHGPMYVKLSDDSLSEIASIVDLIIDAAVERIQSGR